jgi:hypothetical protein
MTGGGVVFLVLGSVLLLLALEIYLSVRRRREVAPSCPVTSMP